MCNLLQCGRPDSAFFVGYQLGFKSTYNSEPCQHALLKRGKSWETLRPQVLPLISTVTEAKRKDVLELLQSISAPPNIIERYSNSLVVGNSAGEEEEL
ncbi:hypothetical protein PoB_000034800 [Plakobranchus ocellatus]|uniref:Uncharacterized protein n=1 Tax=Plakobranchus ocellatus TaxID=259542 RepID=A0AAV3XU25_9GAST|nr:hypothetical protein PoB_000034800 [Plakobranchus ocellatus]